MFRVPGRFLFFLLFLFSTIYRCVRVTYLYLHTTKVIFYEIIKMVNEFKGWIYGLDVAAEVCD